MKLIIVVATSLDEFIAKANDPNPYSWTSPEDKAFFADIRTKHKLFVQGINTFLINDKNPRQGALNVVLTGNPEKYKDRQIDGTLEFAKLTPQEFVKKYQNKYDSCLVLGGSYVYTSFLEAGLIDEIYMTVEPISHGSGVNFLNNGQKLEEMITSYELKVKKLNTSGTLQKHYLLKK